MDINRKRRSYRHLGQIVNIINIILSVVVLASALMIVMYRDKYMILFPVIFVCTGLINLVLSIKYFKRNDRFRFMTLALGFLLFAGFGIFSLIVIM